MRTCATLILTTLFFAMPCVTNAKSLHELNDVRCLSIAAAVPIIGEYLKKNFELAVGSEILGSAELVRTTHTNYVLQRIPDEYQNQALDLADKLRVPEAKAGLEALKSATYKGSISRDHAICVVQNYFYKRYTSEKCESWDILKKCDVAPFELIQKKEIAFDQQMLSKNPQEMYLAAGSYMRNEDPMLAEKLYHQIITRYPNTLWAVKANDELNARKRTEEAEKAARQRLDDAESAARQRQYDAQRAADDANRRERSACSYRISKCDDSCSPLSGSARSACRDRCSSLCNQF